VFGTHLTAKLAWSAGRAIRLTFDVLLTAHFALFAFELALGILKLSCFARVALRCACDWV
tara:strand:- start:587 stop:766 length:180 start_codon:yes stop_codon:yes gene_type:complete